MNNKDKLYPEWHEKPLRLTLAEMKNPIEVIEGFFEEFSLQDVRSRLKDLFTDAVYSGESETGVYDYLTMRENLERLTEAAHLILENKKPGRDLLKSSHETVVEQFMGLLGHELNTQLSTVITAISCIDSYKDENTGKYSMDATFHFNAIRSTITATINVLKNMLATAKLSSDSAEMTVQKETFRVVPFINSFELPFSYYKAIHSKKLDIKLQPLARGELTTDKVKLEQVIYNLLYNAFKFSIPETNVVLDCNWNNSRMVIKVSSIGERIPTEKLDAIFEPYRQLEQGKAGTGLGLYISKLYTELLGGNIAVESRDSGLTIFTVDIPERL